MEEENKVNAYFVNEKYPKEIESYKQKLKDCESVAAKSVMSQSELNDIKKKVKPEASLKIFHSDFYDQI